MLEFIAGLGMGMVLGAALSLATMIYLKGQGYGLQVQETPATEGKVDALLEAVGSLQETAKKHGTRLDALAETVVKLDLDKGVEKYSTRPVWTATDRTIPTEEEPKAQDPSE